MDYRHNIEDDHEQIAKIYVENTKVPSLEEAKEVYDWELERYKFLVAEENGNIIGFISWRINGERRHELVRIKRLIIEDVPNKEEVAEELIRRATDEADKELKRKGFKLRKVFAMVHSHDEEIKKFYEKLGFEHETTLKDHYYNNVDEHVMSLFFE